MSFPPAHAMIGAGLAEVVCAARPLPRWKAWTLASTLAVAPDFDIVLGLLLGKGGAYHGTFTHSVTAAVVAALLAWAVAGRWWGVVAGAGYGSHLLVDLLDDSGPTNMMLAWPFSGDRPYSLGKVFPKVPFEGEGVTESAQSLLLPHVFEKLALQTLLGLAVFLVLLGVAAVVRRFRSTDARTEPASAD